MVGTELLTVEMVGLTRLYALGGLVHEYCHAA
jgi:hypothetical protein